MSDERAANRAEVAHHVRVAERLDSIADTAELMGDDAGAARFRADAATRRMLVMSMLDAASPPPS